MALAAGLSLLCSCAPAPRLPSPEELAGAGAWREAAALYLERAAAEEDPGRRIVYQLQAAELLVRAKEWQSAERTLAELEPPGAPQRLSRDLLRARIALARGRPQRVLELLPAAPAAQLPAGLLAERHDLRARAYEAAGLWLEAAREVAALQPPDHQRLWMLLRSAPLETLREVRTQPQESFSGWVELAVIDKSPWPRPESWDTAIIYWERQYPGHPSRDSVLPQLRRLYRQSVLRPARLAVLLPASGPFADGARAVREGIMAARYRESGTFTTIRVYDTQGQDIPALIERAAADEADLIIGPLTKEAVAALPRSPSVPVLALNRLPPPDAEADAPAASLAPPRAPPPVVEFSLAPEDEAVQVAERARFDGHVTALVFAPRGEWGDRVFQAFRDAWQNLGGIVLERLAYDPQGGSEDYRFWTRELLNVGASELRIARLQQTLGRKFESWTRIRRDADFLFLVAGPPVARQLMPQLRYFEAEAMPVYATSQVYAGTFDLLVDRDLDNIQFVAMPWLLDPDPVGVEDLGELERHWGKPRLDAYAQLFVFGMDAYALGRRLREIYAGDLSFHQGLSGRLHPQADGKVRRRLQWYRFSGGRPVWLGQ